MLDTAIFARELYGFGWTLSTVTPILPCPDPDEVRTAYADAFAQSQPRAIHASITEGMHSGELHPLAVFGYADVVNIRAYMVVESDPETGAGKIMAGCVLVCRMHTDLHKGAPGFEKAYPLGTPATVIQADAAEYLAKHGKRPFNGVAAIDFPGGQRAPEKLQKELASQFPWKTPTYDFYTTNPQSRITGRTPPCRVNPL